jgi:hypothetical protein
MSFRTFSIQDHIHPQRAIHHDTHDLTSIQLQSSHTVDGLNNVSINDPLLNTSLSDRTGNAMSRSPLTRSRHSDYIAIPPDNESDSFARIKTNLSDSSTRPWDRSPSTDFLPVDGQREVSRPDELEEDGSDDVVSPKGDSMSVCL